jgi:hypothetical protein
MPIYELINPSDPITYAADEDIVACAVGLLLGAGKAGMQRVGAEPEALEVLPILLFASEEATRAVLKARGLDIDTLNQWIYDHYEAVASCLESALYGSARDRELFDAMTAGLSPDERRRRQTAWNDRKRSSVNDYSTYSIQLAARLRGRPLSTPTITADVYQHAETFHDHLDGCQQCREHPFDLCSQGRTILTGEAS